MITIKSKKPMDEYIDPIEEFIGTQLRSVSNNEIISIRKEKVKRGLSLWPFQHHKESRSTRNTHEDQLVDALDKKYRKGRRRQDKVMDLLHAGYTQSEIAPLLGVHYSTVKRDIAKIKGRLKLHKEVTNVGGNGEDQGSGDSGPGEVGGSGPEGDQG